MARIKTYIVDNLISDNDIVIGSDGESSGSTRNFTVGNLRTHINSGLAPLVGGTLKITTITDSSLTLLTPHAYFNALVIPLEVQEYEIVFLILNGITYIFRKNDAFYGVGQTEVFESDFTKVDFSIVQNFEGLTSNTLTIVETDKVFNVEVKENLQNLDVSGNNIYKGFDTFTKKHEMKPLIGGGIKIHNNENDIGIDVAFSSDTTGQAIYDSYISNEHRLNGIKAGGGITVTKENRDIIIALTPTDLLTPRGVLQTSLFDSILDTSFVNGGESFLYGGNEYSSFRIKFSEAITLNLDNNKYFFWYYEYPNMIAMPTIIPIKNAQLTVINGDTVNASISLGTMTTPAFPFGWITIGFTHGVVNGFSGNIPLNLHRIYFTVAT